MRDPWAQDVEVVSSENVAFGVESAGLGSRFAAAGIDVLLQALILSLSSYVVAQSLEYIQVDKWSPALRNIAQALMGLAAFGILWGYYFAFEWRWDGQTPGKRALGLRVLHIDGSPLTLWGSLVRNLVRIFDFLPLFYGFGAVITLLGPNNRRAGDLAAGTIVARERHDATAQVLGIAQAADAFLSSNSSTHNSRTPAHAAPLESLDAVEASAPPDLEIMALRSRLKAQDWELALDFARRRDTLPAAVRERLATRLAQQLAAKATLQLEGEPEAFVMRVAQEAARQSQRA
jgi:uncharacterized RDD family membrane protein YckC